MREHTLRRWGTGRAGRARLLAAVTVASLGLVACGSSNSTGSSASSSPSAATSGSAAAKSNLKVGMAYDVGGRGDRSFNDAAAAGLDKAVKELGVTKQELSPNTTGSDRGDNLRKLAEGGYNPIVAVGFSYATDLAKVAKDFPDTSFFIVDDSTVTAPNVHSLVFAEEQGSYLVGAAAALKSAKNSVGYVGGVQTPLLQKFEAGYLAGAKKIKPDIKTQVKYLSQPPDFSGFGSPDKGRESANGMYDAGADVVFAAAGGSGTGVFQAAKAKGGKAIGVDSDQYLSIADPSLQPVILTSMIKRVDVAVFDAMRDTVNKKPIQPVARFDLASDGIAVATSGGFIDDIKPQLDALATQIKSGAIQVPSTPAP
jgi:basic membrane protein A